MVEQIKRLEIQISSPKLEKEVEFAETALPTSSAEEAAMTTFWSWW